MSEFYRHTKERILQTEVAQHIGQLLRPEQFAAAKESLLASARSNAETFRAYSHEQSLHGQKHKEAREKPELADHAEPHFVRQGMWADQILKSPELHITDWEIAQAFALFSNGHDANQLDIAHANSLKENTADHLNPRNGRHHEVAATLQMLAQADAYAKATGLSKEQAKRITSYAGLMMLFHDSQDVLRPSLTHTRSKRGTKAYTETHGFNRQTRKFETHREMLHGDDLIALFTKNEKGVIPGCDFLSLSPKQIVELTRYFKQQSDARFVTDKTPFGLDEEFEAHFGEQLRDLDEDKSDQPLFTNISKRQRREFVTALEANVLGDQLEAIVPTGIGLLRTLSNGHARTRPLFDDSTTDYLVYTTEPSPKGDTDLARKLREVLLVADVIKGSNLAKTRFVRENLASMQVDYIEQLKTYGSTLMSGDRDKIEDMVRGIWEDELRKTAEVYLANAGLEAPRVQDDVSTLGKVNQTIEQLQHAGKNTLYEDLKYLRDELAHRINHTMVSIMDPRKYAGRDLSEFDFPDGMTQEDLQNAKGALVTFSPARITRFQQICDEVLYGPSSDDRTRLKEFRLYKAPPTDSTNPDPRKGNNPRYLAQYSYAHPFLNAFPMIEAKSTFPYSNYLRPNHI